MTRPWIGAALVVALGVSHGAVWLAGRQHGVAIERRVRDLADTRREAAANARAAEAQRLAREAEHQAALRLAALETEYQEESARELAARDRTIAELRAGQRRLYIDVQPAARGDASAPGAGPGHPPARAELSPAAGAFLVGLAGEADAAVVDLNYCIDRLSGAEGR